jgi:hypothetical protein
LLVVPLPCHLSKIHLVRHAEEHHDGIEEIPLPALPGGSTSGLCFVPKKLMVTTGWWYTYPLKNMSSSDWIIIPTIGENKKMFQTTNQVISLSA